MSSIMKAIRGCSTSFYLERLEDYCKTLFDRFCPFKIGSKVALTKDYPCTGGWVGYDKMMVKGAKATVKDVDCRNGVFVAYIVFDNEFYESKDHLGNLKIYGRDEERKHTFCIDESYLVVIDA